MSRLRRTVGLSLLALVVGIAGTAWLTTLTGDWTGPSGASVRADRIRTVLRRHARPVAPHAAVAPAAIRHAEPSAEPEAWPSLTPIDMPPLPASLLRRETFTHGRVVLHLVVDGAGHVDRATVAESSGDAALDDRALRTVRRWRFAVPTDRPDGLGGTLVMRYDTP